MAIAESQESTLENIQIDGEDFYRISNVEKMRPFLMSIVSDSNHWMFISSNGGLTAGRKDSEHALFPYYTDDKLTESYDITGSKSIFQVDVKGETKIWEPFAEHHNGLYDLKRNLYKNLYGNKILFEEVNNNLGLTFRYQWSSSNTYGFVKKSVLENNTESEIKVRLLDGIQNIMPHGVPSDLQNSRSNLVDAYKRNELKDDAGIGIYALSSVIIDRAEPSEALKANIAWSTGLKNPTCLISSLQVDSFRRGQHLTQEKEIKANKGAYFVSAPITLPAGGQNSWMIIADVSKSVSNIEGLSKHIMADHTISSSIAKDIEIGSKKLIQLVSASDGFQCTADSRRNARHYSNTLFNIMRGGIFDHNYEIERWDFEDYLQNANPNTLARNKKSIEQLPEVFDLQTLRSLTHQNDDKDFVRLSLEYMPLKFSRRHGDPSRPWNKFSINTRSELDGSKILDYEGNWRDIFQNWEALAHAYPEFIDNMILKFLNASTFDGYNPYRITKDGFDWEIIEAHDPWSYIGYWGDHQVIYLLKFLEFIQDHFPNRLSGYYHKEVFVYANVPYKIKGYEEILENPKDTIIFDYKLNEQIGELKEQKGSDGTLIHGDKGVYYVNFIEKILALTLAKISNFIPEGGIWMNTQRPEWNDANNALVGNGVSMVTLSYLRRFLSFFSRHLQSITEVREFQISEELKEFFVGVKAGLEENQDILSTKVSNKQRKKVLDAIGTAGSIYRDQIYAKSFSGKKVTISQAELLAFFDISISYMEHSIDANKRQDNMYHAYNLMSVESEEEISISHLDEMLEGQVAVLSSGQLSAKECLELLDALKESKLFRKDQYSYLLYPDKELPRFLDKNIIPKDKVDSSSLLKQLSADDNPQIVERDINGVYHFNGNFKNASDLKETLQALSAEGYKELVEKDRSLILQIFESVFNHKAFTGRSQTFYGYEGLGSIYWHMVSKLLLAVEECCLWAVEEGEPDEIIGKLMEHYYEINEGIGVHKSPALYGAFPIDPYSHTPASKGVQQPGMTGQVKEDILSRLGELGVSVSNGVLHFNPCLLRRDEFLKDKCTFNYIDVNQLSNSMILEKDTLAFTYCQVPVLYAISEVDGIEVHLNNGSFTSFDSFLLDDETSQSIFSRTGEIDHIKVSITKTILN